MKDFKVSLHSVRWNDEYDGNATNIETQRAGIRMMIVILTE